MYYCSICCEECNIPENQDYSGLKIISSDGAKFLTVSTERSHNKCFEIYQSLMTANMSCPICYKKIEHNFFSIIKSDSLEIYCTPICFYNRNIFNEKETINT